MYRVLIVDDEIMIRRGLARIIKWEEIGYEVAGAVGNAKEAIQILEEKGADVLLTDISMPEMSGLELIRRAKELNPALRTVVISGYSEFDYAIEAIKLKVENYILKPLDPKKITEIFEGLKRSLDEEQKNQKREQYLKSEYEMLRASETGGRDCQEEFLRRMEEGRQTEALQMAEELFDSLDGGERASQACLKVLRSAVLYFHIDTPPYFDIYRLNGREEEDRERVRACFLEDLEKICSCLREQSESTVMLISRQARRCIQEGYPDKNLSLKTVAARLGVSYGYLSTAFAKTYGENFKACLAAVRLEKARELLMERRYKIYEIADMTGYGSPRYFTDAFKRHYGISPADYLSRLSGGKEE